MAKMNWDTDVSPIVADMVREFSTSGSLFHSAWHLQWHPLQDI